MFIDELELQEQHTQQALDERYYYEVIYATQLNNQELELEQSEAYYNLTEELQ